MKTQMDTKNNQWVMEDEDKQCSCGRKKGVWHSSFSHVYGEDKDFPVVIHTEMKAPKLGKINDQQKTEGGVG